MADNLRKLVSTESLRSMQDKLENWLREYNVSQGGRPPEFVLTSKQNPRSVWGGVAALQSPTLATPSRYLLSDPHLGEGRNFGFPFLNPWSVGLRVGEKGVR